MNTFTLSGTLNDGQNNPIVNKYVRFRVTSVGTDTEDGAVYPRHSFDFKTDSSGNLQGESGSNTVWVNGDSGVQSYYEISLPDGQKVDVVIPSSVEGTTVSLDDIIENYQVDGSTQQGTTLASAKAYTDVLADDPTNNTSFDAANWRAGLDLEVGTDVQAYDAGLNDIAGLTPTNQSIIKGDGTNWVAATNFRVNAGLAGTGMEVGDACVADGDNAVAFGNLTTASGAASTATGLFSTASGDYSVATGLSSVASGDYSVAMGLSAAASGDDSVAMGRRAKAIYDGSRVEADSQDRDVSSTTTDQYTARFQNGYVIEEGRLTAKHGISTPTTSVTATTYTTLATDSVILVDDDTAAAEVTVTLLAAATAGDGFLLNIKKTGSTANVVIDGSGAETIDGATTNTLTTQYESVKLICDGTEWHII